MEALRANGIEPVHRDCGTRDALSPLIVEHGRDVDCVVVGGGDGTINAAAPGVMERDLPLGILPLGTANDLARTLGIPVELGAAAKIIADGHKRTIDLGIVNEQPFFNVASLGLSAELALQLTQDIKRRWGRMGYALVALRVLSRARPFTAVITSREGSKRVRTLQIAVGNGRYYGGGTAVERPATGEHGAWEEVRAIRAKEFTIRTRRPRPINADGEIVSQTPAKFTLRENAVTVFTPPLTAET
jgi:diacylglycerol kinase family enzyme